MFNFFDNAATILSLPSWIRRPKTPCKEKRSVTIENLSFLAFVHE